MAGLPFNSLPAHVVGTATDSTGRRVDLQRLGNTLAGRDEDVIVENGVIHPADSRPAGYMGPWAEQAPAATVAQSHPADNTDPFVMLGQLRDTAMKQVTPLFDAQEQALKGQIGKTKADLYKQYLVEAEGLNGLGLDQEQIQKRHQQLKTKYKMAYAKATSEIEPAMQELAIERQKATARVEAAHAERSLRISQVQAMADKGLIDPVAAKQEQLGILGYSVPLSTLRPAEAQTPRQRLGELRPIYTDLLKQADRYKKYPGGWRVYDETAHDRYPNSPDKWYAAKATPEQTVEAEDLHAQLQDVRGQLDVLNRVVGQQPSLTESAASPVGQAIAAAKLAKTVTSVAMNPFRSRPGGSAEEIRMVGGRRFKRVGADQWVPVE